MRPIKFRYKYESPSGSIFLKSFTLDEIEGGYQYDEISDSPLLKDYRIVARDQFTGLKDKNGVEIYESDIVCNCEKWPLEVNFRDGAFWAEALLLAAEPDVEVIGNIHETPELLGMDG